MQSPTMRDDEELERTREEGRQVYNGDTKDAMTMNAIFCFLYPVGVLFFILNIVAFKIVSFDLLALCGDDFAVSLHRFVMTWWVIDAFNLALQTLVGGYTLCHGFLACQKSYATCTGLFFIEASTFIMKGIHLGFYWSAFPIEASPISAGFYTNPFEHVNCTNGMEPAPRAYADLAFLNGVVKTQIFLYFCTFCVLALSLIVYYCYYEGLFCLAIVWASET